jgi:hypothetical protein
MMFQSGFGLRPINGLLSINTANQGATELERLDPLASVKATLELPHLVYLCYFQSSSTGVDS